MACFYDQIWHIFPEKMIYFQEGFVTVQTLSSLQHLGTEEKAEGTGTRRWKGLLQDQGSYSLFPPCYTLPVEQPEHACHTPAL